MCRELAAAGAGLARRDRNVEGAGRREEVGAGRPGQEAAQGGGGHPAQVRGPGQDRGAAAGQAWTLLGLVSRRPVWPLKKHFCSTYCVQSLRPQGWAEIYAYPGHPELVGEKISRQVVGERLGTGREEAPGPSAMSGR